MKNYVLIFIALFTFVCSEMSAQDFTGSYVSHYTTYKDNTDAQNNFEEHTRFNIAVGFKNKNTGVVIIQDPRIPDRSLDFNVDALVFSGVKAGRQLSIYKGELVLGKSKPAKIVFYKDDKDQLNLLISLKTMTQVFHDLKKDEME